MPHRSKRQKCGGMCLTPCCAGCTGTKMRPLLSLSSKVSGTIASVLNIELLLVIIQRGILWVMKPWITQAIYVYQLVTICSSGVCQPHFGGLAAAAVTGEGAEAGRQQQEFRRLPAGILWLRCSQQCNCGQNLYLLGGMSKRLCADSYQHSTARKTERLKVLKLC